MFARYGKRQGRAQSLRLDVSWVAPTLHRVPMYRRIGPINCSRDKPVFDRVPMAISNIGPKGRLITDAMFPKAPLPNPAFPFSCFALTHCCRNARVLGKLCNTPTIAS